MEISVGTRRVSAAGLAPTSGEIVTQIQLGGSSTDSLVRILHAQPGSPVSTNANVSALERFGRRAETLPEDQMLLGLEDVEQVAASGEAESDAANPAEQANRSAKRRMNRGSLPAQLPHKAPTCART